MWIPDIRTLFLILFLVNVFLTLLLFSFWKTQKTYNGFKTWMLSLLVASCGYFLYMIGGSLPVLLSSTGANLVIALSVMIRLDSTWKYFRSRALPWIIYGTVIPAALLLFYSVFFVDSVVIRGVIIALIIVPCFIAASLIAIRFREPETRSLRYGFATALLVTGLLWTVIVVVAIITPGNHSLSGPDPLNPIFFIVTILMDIVATVFFLLLNMARSHTDLQKSEEALSRANKKLKLLSSITRHDINNQLTVLRGYLSILEMEQPDPSLNEYCSKAATAAQRISSMIQFTNEYEKIGVEAPVWQDCRPLVDAAAKQAPLGQIVVKNDLPAGAEVFADSLIGKVFYNLMDNAVRYGGKITTIRFTVEERDGDHLIVCEDDGEGIVADKKEKIFDRGFGKNTGLGLALSREILSITGITVTENGEPGKGARFEMTVPKGAWRIASPMKE